MDTETLKLLIFLALGGTALACSAVWSLFLAEVQLRDSETWDELGRPSLVADGRVRSPWVLARFVLSGRFRALKSAKARRLAIAAGVSSVATLTLLVALFVVDWTT